jgi:uridylate kinase
MPGDPVYRRILLKLSGEVLAGGRDGGIDPKQLEYVASEIKETRETGVEIGIVIGGGNIHRGEANEKIISRVTGDYMGMLATVINSLALQATLEAMDLKTRVMTAFRIEAVAEPYIRRRAIRHLEKGRIIIMAAGTGNPYFTTDTAAGLRGIETKVDAILKATKVDGIYDSDPAVNKDAERFRRTTYDEAIKRNLRVMDQTAFTLCRENEMPIVVFRFADRGNLKRVVMGEDVGTLVTS